MKQKAFIRIILIILLFVMPFWAWLGMFGGVSGVLSSRGWSSLKYFTVLSNLFEGIVSAIWTGSALASILKKESSGVEASHIAEVLKYIACACVFLTFITVMVFLGPMFGYVSMFIGANFWLHLVVPLAAIAEMFFLVREDFSLKENVYTIIPVLIYGTAYLINIVVNGRGDNASGWNDFYGFVTWGFPVGILIFAVICLIVFLFGAVIRRINYRK